MICLIRDYDYRTGVAEALPVMYADFVDQDPRSFTYKVYADPKIARLSPGTCYSFYPRDFSKSGYFIRGELDYEFFKANQRA